MSSSFPASGSEYSTEDHRSFGNLIPNTRRLLPSVTAVIINRKKKKKQWNKAGRYFYFDAPHFHSLGLSGTILGYVGEHKVYSKRPHTRQTQGRREGKDGDRDCTDGTTSSGTLSNF